jgi:hypothetical protein
MTVGPTESRTQGRALSQSLSIADGRMTGSTELGEMVIFPFFRARSPRPEMHNAYMQALFQFSTSNGRAILPSDDEKSGRDDVGIVKAENKIFSGPRTSNKCWIMRLAAMIMGNRGHRFKWSCRRTMA